MTLFDRFRFALSEGSANRQAGRAARLRVEPLEPREVPATPTISAITRQFGQVNTALAVTFTVNEQGLPPSTLVVTAASGNTTVVPNSGLRILGDAGQRTLMITPAGNQVGQVDITLTVRDPSGNQVQKVVPVLVGAPQILPASDNFNRADAVFLGVPWTEDTGEFAIAASQGEASTQKVSVATLNGLLAPDVSVQAEITVAAGQSVGLVARYTGPKDKNMYLGKIVASGSTFKAQLVRNFNGTSTTLVSQKVDTGTGTLRLEVVGSSLKLFLNNDLVAFANDGKLTAPGSVGFRVTSGAGFDNFFAAAITPASPTLPFTDSFTTATDEQLNANWVSEAGNFQVAGGVATGVAPLDVATLSGLQTADVSVQANVSAAAGQTVGLVARYSGPKDQNTYLGRLVGTATGFKAELVRNYNGVATRLYSKPVEGTASGVLRLEVVGPSLKLFLNGAIVAFANDTMLTAGSVGMVSSAGATLDDFAASTLTLSNATVGFTDAFSTATNQQLSSFWLNRFGNFQVAGGRATGLGPTNLATLNGVSTANVTVQADVSVTGGKGQQAGLVTRYTGAGDSNMYFAGLVNIGTGFQVQVRRNVNGVWKTLAIATVSAGAGTLRFDTSGSNLTVTFNNQEVLSITDTGITGPGTVGMRATAGATVDNFSAN